MFPQKRRITLLFTVYSSCMLLLFFSGCESTGATKPAGVIKVVAAENFYGDVVKQLGGSHVSVTSILSDPNTDPHTYESDNATAQAVSTAQLVIENGLEYDSWMEKLLSASPNPQRIVLIAGNLADHKLPDNPHVWYGINNMATIATAISKQLKKLDSADASTFDQRLTAFLNSLQPILQTMNHLKTNYASTPVGLTETIYLYQTTPIGLHVLTPYDFQKANAEGNDPPADSVVTANDQIKQKQIKILIYNQQTITTITTNMQNEAKRLHIPLLSVWETMPAGQTYQSWMQGQLDKLGQALAIATGK